MGPISLCVYQIEGQFDQGRETGLTPITLRESYSPVGDASPTALGGLCYIS